MNAKQCKKLRKEARKFCKTLDTGYVLKGAGMHGFFLGQATLVPGCFRAVYQEAKKLLSQKAIPFKVA